ncbi:MAG: redoxin family protein [Spirochaetaceae bacterium]|jgi:thiol-disulfide isomerase/thioredoxin|nr:redoxin family protein [Spirochaetaceae bacterium]
MKIFRKIIMFGLAAALIAGVPANGFADAPAVGKTAPDFAFAIEGAARQKLSDYRGKPVALHFWAGWCGPCVRELPLIAELAASKSGVLTVIAVNCAEPASVASSFLAKRKLRMNLALDPDGAISRLYNINAIPQTFLIDSNGVIRSIQIGAYTKKTLDADISALLSN